MSDLAEFTERLRAQVWLMEREGYLTVARLLSEAAWRLEQASEAQRDAERWRAVASNNGQEFDLSSGPGSSKVLLLRLDVSGLERWLESGAPDYAAMMNAVADDEIERRAALAKASGEPT